MLWWGREGGPICLGGGHSGQQWIRTFGEAHWGQGQGAWFWIPCNKQRSLSTYWTPHMMFQKSLSSYFTVLARLIHQILMLFDAHLWGPNFPFSHLRSQSRTWQRCGIARRHRRGSHLNMISGIYLASLRVKKKQVFILCVIWECLSFSPVVDG